MHVVHWLRVPLVRSVLVSAVAALASVGVATGDTRVRVELTDRGDCSVTTNGPGGRSHVRYPRHLADWRCAVTTVHDMGAVDLEVVAPPGADRPASSFPQLAWREEGGRWVGRGRMPAPPAFVRLVPAGAARERWLDLTVAAAAIAAALWALAVARGQ